jgi:N-acetylglucosamine-6-phosphate deacetylase
VTTTLTCDRFFDGESFRGSTRITIADDRVVSIDPHQGKADFHILAPGLIDLQMNGFSTVDVSEATVDELITLDLHLLSLGTTGWLATVITAPLERLTDRISFLDEVFRSGVCPGMLGIHIEGPFLGSAPGAHRPDWIVPIDLGWLSRLPESIRLVTIAPEQPDAAEATKLLSAKNVVVSMGHSRPTTQQIDDMIENGSTMSTHLFNGMSGVHHRDTGLALKTLIDHRVTAGLIADMSHVSAEAVSLAFAAKGPTGVCLVSDTVAWETERALRRGIELRDGAPQLTDGTLAGSATPLSECVRRCVHDAGVDSDVALRAATQTPARLLGISEQRWCQPGSVVDLIALDRDLHVVGVWRRLVSRCA